MKSKLSSAAEDYLKTIYKLQSQGEAVTTQAIASRLKVSAPSASAMMKKLAAQKLVRHEKYRGVLLTSAGEKIALETIRHHRLIETFLAEVLGVSWDKVHDEAERIEHVLSEEVEARISAALNHPTRDPHGAAIPSVDGKIARDTWTSLCEMPAGTRGVVRRVSDENSETLRHLHELQITPGTEIAVARAVAVEGVLQLRVAGKRRTLGIAPAQSVFVEISS